MSGNECGGVRKSPVAAAGVRRVVSVGKGGGWFSVFMWLHQIPSLLLSPALCKE